MAGPCRGQMRDRPRGRGGVGLSKARTARLIVAFWAGLAACVAEAQAEEVYRWIDSRGVVHLTNVPADRHFEKYRVGSAGGSGKGILIIARRESARRRPFAFRATTAATRRPRPTWTA